MTRCRRSVSEGCSRGIDRETSRVPSPAFLNSRADDFADFAGSQIGRGCSLPPTQGQLVIASQSSYACGTLRAITVGVGGISVVVGAEAFKDSAATSVTFAGDVQSIGAEAFEACEHLANLTILGAVTQSIGQNAFKGSGLVRVVFGGSVSTGVSRWHWRRFHQCGASARPPGCVLNLLNAERLPPPVARRPRLPPAPPIYDSSLAGLVDRHRSLRGLRILGHHQHPGHPLEPRLFGCPSPPYIHISDRDRQPWDATSARAAPTVLSGANSLTRQHRRRPPFCPRSRQHALRILQAWDAALRLRHLRPDGRPDAVARRPRSRFVASFGSAFPLSVFPGVVSVFLPET